ncbi:squalene/phytoene synthase family protein [Algicella marina]|nr:squalene/phytoene synthase family protein [Algicella marina]
MSIDACAAAVAANDPDRFACAMLAPMPRRGALMVLYAFNLEVARAPWVTAEPMIAEMRLQWWRDVLDEIAGGGPVRRHEVATPLAQVARDHALPHATMLALIDARRRDSQLEPPADIAELDLYFSETAGGLMTLATRILTDEEPEAARLMGQGSGAANYLAALPVLKETGRAPLPNGDAAATITQIAKTGLRRIDEARSLRPSVPKAALPALLTGWRAQHLLSSARARPQLALSGGLEPPEILSRATRLWRGSTGRW